MSKVSDEIAQARKEADDVVKADIVQNEETARISAEMRKEFENSDQGEVTRQNERADKIMRMSTPDALKELGCEVGDHLKGPSS